MPIARTLLSRLRASRRLPPIVAVATALAVVPIGALSCECELPPGDSAAVSKVQSSWAAGFRWTQAGDYARALILLRATSIEVRHIHDARTRTCVVNGAHNLIASAAAGQAYLARHPDDVGGAKVAATRAWHVFLVCQ